MRRVKYFAWARVGGREYERARISSNYFEYLTGERVRGDVEFFAGDNMIKRGEYIAHAEGKYLGVYEFEKVL